MDQHAFGNAIWLTLKSCSHSAGLATLVLAWEFLQWTLPPHSELPTQMQRPQSLLEQIQTKCPPLVKLQSGAMPTGVVSGTKPWCRICTALPSDLRCHIHPKPAVKATIPPRHSFSEAGQTGPFGSQCALPHRGRVYWPLATWGSKARRACTQSAEGLWCWSSRPDCHHAVLSLGEAQNNLHRCALTAFVLCRWLGHLKQAQHQCLFRQGSPGDSTWLGTVELRKAGENWNTCTIRTWLVVICIARRTRSINNVACTTPKKHEKFALYI